jgi:hypothetical protein
MSPGKSLFRRPQFSVKCLSDTRPPYPHDKNEIAPCGVIPIKYFTVLWCLNISWHDTYHVCSHEMPDIMARQRRASDVYANGISQVLWC